MQKDLKEMAEELINELKIKPTGLRTQGEIINQINKKIEEYRLDQKNNLVLRTYLSKILADKPYQFSILAQRILE